MSLVLLLLSSEQKGSLACKVHIMDDQADSSLDQMVISSAGTSYSIWLTYTKMEIESIEIYYTKSSNQFQLLSGYLRNIISGDLYAHGETSNQQAGSSQLVTGRNSIITNFHIANETSRYGSEYVSPSLSLESLHESSIDYAVIHIRSLILGGNFLAPATKPFEIRTDEVDITVVPVNPVRVNRIQTSLLEFQWKTHLLMKDTGVTGDTMILNALYNRSSSYTNPQLNQTILNEIKKNLKNYFVQYR